MHLNSRLLFEKHAKSHFREGLRVLEIGPDGDPSTYWKLAGRPSGEWHTADLAVAVGTEGEHRFMEGAPNAFTHLMKSEYEIPVENDTYDVVLSGQVMEHVRHIWRWMPELARVCRPGGHVITISPVSWPYHEVPYDCWRAYPEGMRALSDEAGLEVVVCESESLEPPASRNTYPGISYAEFAPSGALKAAVKRMIGWPLPVAVDTVTIARKPL
jgi:ubiquinone/menaquinone biosynthesis C-methylase UbiE